MQRSYYKTPGGHPGQDQLLSGRAVFTDAYAVLPRGTMQDITVSYLPFWEGTRLWVLARPMTGFAETFSHYLMEVQPGGGCHTPELDPGAEGALFVTGGKGVLTTDGFDHELTEGSFAYLPPEADWQIWNRGDEPLIFHWIRKQYQKVDGIDVPGILISNDNDVMPVSMPGTEGNWATTRFVSPTDLRHDMQLNVVTIYPGVAIPFTETHVMEHGLYVLQGKGVYRLNTDWVEVHAGDYMWLRAFCPQACYAGGPGPFRYLLYKDVNRHMPLTPPR